MAFIRGDDGDFIDRTDFIEHYGTPKRSGRYPYGSGDNPGQHGSGDFLTRVQEYKKQGLSEKEIAKALNMNTRELRSRKSEANDERRQYLYKTAKGLQDEGKGATEIGKVMGLNESSVRSLLNEQSRLNMNKTEGTTKFLREQVDKYKLVDVGVGAERNINLDGNAESMGVSQTRMNTALTRLKDEGYNVYNYKVPQATNPGKFTTLSVLASPEISYDAGYKAKDKGDIHFINEYSFDGGKTFEAPRKPESISSDRVKIKYNEEGGIEKDGLIEIRRGVPDLSMGNSTYAQVRIGVDGTHYLKGMAIYSDDIPKGYDIVFNTNKKVGTPKDKVLKEASDDPDNPFKALIKRDGQVTYIGSDGKEHLSAINKVHEEGDWMEYSKKLPSQFLAKQKYPLIKKQLDLTYADKDDEFQEIMDLTNPTIKKHYLKEFAASCDSDAVHLKAAALPRQAYRVILPIPSLKENEVYAPSFNSGEKVALVRFPHGGTFEIPIVKVNNKHADAKKAIGNAIDAVGINSEVAARLSGADFDGDTVLVIPIGRKVEITSTPKLKGLEGFDSKEKYGTEEKITSDGKKEYYNKNGTKIKVMSNTQNEMGRISNLITDMTLKGATEDELAPAVRHSMVVIDAEKHKLDYKQSEIDNNIAYLKKRYQAHYTEDGRYSEGASTLLSRSKAETRVPERKGTPYWNQKGKKWYDPSLPEGAEIYKLSGKNKVIKGKERKNGTFSPDKIVPATFKSTQMAETKDARSLSSGTKQEEAYADYANKLKALANKARKEYVYTKGIEENPSAKKVYATEVSSLKAKLNTALKNAPKERQAQVLTLGVMNAKKDANGEIDKDEYKKLKQKTIEEMRAKVGAVPVKERHIPITDREWSAIQAGAISDHTLSQILDNTDPDSLRERATPRVKTELSTSRVNRIHAMEASGYTVSAIAKALNVSTTTVSKNLERRTSNG